MRLETGGATGRIRLAAPQQVAGPADRLLPTGAWIVACFTKPCPVRFAKLSRPPIMSGTMAKLLKLKLGVADDPTALQPSLNDCLSTMLQQAEPLMGEVLQGLVKGMAPLGPQSVAAFQQPNIKTAILALDMDGQAARDTYKA